MTLSARPEKKIYDQESVSFDYYTTGNLGSTTSSDSVTTAYTYDGAPTTRQTTSGLHLQQ